MKKTLLIFTFIWFVVFLYVQLTQVEMVQFFLTIYVLGFAFLGYWLLAQYALVKAVFNIYKSRKKTASWQLALSILLLLPILYLIWFLHVH